MKNLSKILFVSIFALVASSCGDQFLTRDPYGSTVTQEQYEKMANKLEGSVRGIYSILSTYRLSSDAHDEFGKRGVDLYTDLMSGDIALTDHKYGWLYSDELGQGNTGRTSYLWYFYYGMLRNINSVIRTAKNGDNSVVNRIAQFGLPNTYNSKKGEYYTIVAGDTLARFTDTEAEVAFFYAQALTMRGYIYSNLVMWYCETPSNVADFTKEICFPIYNETNMESAQGLAVMSEVYTQIESDLTEAIDYFDAFNTFTRNTKLEVDGSVACGILAYSYLNKGNPKGNRNGDAYRQAYTNARDYALKAILLSPCTILPRRELTETGFNDVNGISWMWGQDVTTETAGGLASWFGQCDIHSYSYAWAGDTKAIDENLYKQIVDSSASVLHHFDARVLWFNDGSQNSVYKLCGDGKFYSAQSRNSTKAEDIDREWLSDNVFMRIESMYLIAAEASYRLNNDADAISFLTAITDERVLEGKEAVYAEYKSNLNHSNLLNEIGYNWRVELWGEGYGLMTFRRLGPELPERKRGGNHDGDPGSKMEVGSQYIFPIPSSETSYNPNITTTSL